MSETLRDKDNELKKKSFFSHSFAANPLRSPGSEDPDPRRFLHRQKSDFSEEELQELQRKLERWIQESRAQRISYDGLSELEFEEPGTQGDGRSDDEYEDGDL
ncbi:MAG: hypothetical protein D6736_00445 [Nitrospinota bacterium]|nr:MAG: hypothetical protein D6736_00445 [Nitrospinota bacterium]